MHGFFHVSKNTIYNAINTLNSQPLVYEEHKTYIRTQTIENPQISGETLALGIYAFSGLKVSDTTIIIIRNKNIDFQTTMQPRGYMSHYGKKS